VIWGCVAEMSSSATYDESQVRKALDELPVTGRIIFAAACAEWLYPSYEEFVRAAGLGDAAALRTAIDTAWAIASGEAVAPDEVERQRAAAESLVPSDDDEDWLTLSALAQNSAASAAYAIRAWLTGDSQEAVWAARQLYEAGDYIVQLGAASQSYAQSTDLDLPASLSVSGIVRALEHAGRNAPDRARQDAVAGGKRLRELWSEDPSS